MNRRVRIFLRHLARENVVWKHRAIEGDVERHHHRVLEHAYYRRETRRERRFHQRLGVKRRPLMLLEFVVAEFDEVSNG